MNRIHLFLATALLAIVITGHAQTSLYRIAYVRAEQPPTEYIDAFRRGLGELGYVEGKNYLVDAKWADGKEEKLRTLFAEIVRLKFDVIVASAPAATHAAMEATSTIPIVMVHVADPVNFKFVASLARPGGNVTGFAYLLPELSGKRLQLLKEIAPKLSRVAVVWNGNNPYKPFDLKEVQAVADHLRVKVLGYPVRNSTEFASAFEAASKQGAQGLITLEDPFMVAQRKQIVDLALKYRLPAVYGLKPYMEAGGLMSYGPDPLDQNRRAAAVVDRLLKGAKPADLPVERPTKFEFMISKKVAAAIGVSIPASMQMRADEVME